MKHEPRCDCRQCIARAHKRLVNDLKIAIGEKYGARAYVDGVTQYHGQTVRQGVVGPWIDAGMARGTFDLFVCFEGRCIWLDAKTGCATLSAEQRGFQSWIRAAGGVAESFRSVEEGLSHLEKK